MLKGADIRQVGYVPDAGHSRLIARCKADPGIRDVVLTTEEEGVAMAAGAWLGGQRSALLMQSSGVGNCVNMLSLISRLPLSDADAGDDARRVGGVQSLAGADGLDRRADAEALRHPCRQGRQPNEVVPAVQNALQLAFGDDRAAAVLLSQKLIGRKVWVK